jgi:acyl carrier protein
MEERIRNVMAAVLGISSSQIGEQSSPKNIGSWDSLRHMNLVIALEEEFGIQFADSEIPELTGYALIRQAIQKRIAK